MLVEAKITSSEGKRRVTLDEDLEEGEYVLEGESPVVVVGMEVEVVVVGTEDEVEVEWREGVVGSSEYGVGWDCGCC